MCGIVGFLRPKADDKLKDITSHVRHMADQISHRGPDGSGEWVDESCGVALAHRRLSILDLSSAGAQPMQSESGRYLIIFNGEIYNHLELRRSLEAKLGSHRWRGHSDTETILACVTHLGVIATLEMMTGMFAFALWDRQEKALTLARDRLGEKPLYYGHHEGTLLFGSELKALRAYSSKAFSINQQAVAGFLKYSYVPSPLSIFEGISKLAPGHYIVFRNADDESLPQSYWSIAETAQQGSRSSLTGSRKDITDYVESVLSDAVQSQLISDVPLGVFLSGGIDSSLITSLMVKTASSQVKSFSIGFENAHFNEAIYAREIAAHLGTDHHEFVITEKDALECIPKLPLAFDEPFADSSQIPTMILCEKTRKYVTVALSGDGGDEIFGGYNRYIFAPKLWSRFGKFPSPVRRLIAGMSGAAQSRINGKDDGFIARGIGAMRLPKSSLQRLSKFGRAIGYAQNFPDFFDNLISAWPDYTEVTRGGGNELGHDFSILLPELSKAERMMVFDALTYMADDILVKVDRSAMFHSLETRAPFLDPEVISTAWKVDMGLKIEKGSGKKILKDILHSYVPKEMFDRPKQGFSIPVDDWLRGELKEWAGDHISQGNLDYYPFIDGDKIKQAFSDHVTGKDNFGYRLWPVIMLMAWTETYRNARF